MVAAGATREAAQARGARVYSHFRERTRVAITADNTSRNGDAHASVRREEHLVRRARRDRGAFSALYQEHADRVYRYLLSRTSSPADAEELTSRTFLNALAHLDQYHGRGKGFGAWLMSIAHNLLANWYRDRGRRPPTADLDAALTVPTDTPGPESSLETNELIQRVRQAVSTLAEDRQRLIALKYVDGLPNAEIGRMMGRTEGAVKALHHRTLRELQRRLGEDDGA